MCLAIALTATRMGATIANHTEVLELTKGQDSDCKEIVTGAKVRDRLSGKLSFFALYCSTTCCSTTHVLVGFLVCFFSCYILYLVYDLIINNSNELCLVMQNYLLVKYFASTTVLRHLLVCLV